LVIAKEKRRTTISILLQTKAALDSIKHEGQSYNGVVQELVKFWKDKGSEYWTRRQRGEGKNRADMAGVRS